MVNQRKKGAGKKVTDFLYFRDAFTYVPNSGDADVDSDIKNFMAAFAGRLIINRRGE